MFDCRKMSKKNARSYSRDYSYISWYYNVIVGPTMTMSVLIKKLKNPRFIILGAYNMFEKSWTDILEHIVWPILEVQEM